MLLLLLLFDSTTVYHYLHQGMRKFSKISKKVLLIIMLIFPFLIYLKQHTKIITSLTHPFFWVNWVEMETFFTNCVGLKLSKMLHFTMCNNILVGATCMFACNTITTNALLKYLN